jgi:hypothetical protein
MKLATTQKLTSISLGMFSCRRSRALEYQAAAQQPRGLRSRAARPITNTLPRRRLQVAEFRRPAIAGRDPRLYAFSGTDPRLLGADQVGVGLNDYIDGHLARDSHRLGSKVPASNDIGVEAQVAHLQLDATF